MKEQEETTNRGVGPAKFFKPEGPLHTENPLKNRVVAALAEAMRVAVELDRHPGLERSGMEPLFTYHVEDVIDALDVDQVFDPQIGIVDRRTYFTSNNDTWSGRDLPRLVGEIAPGNPPIRSVKLETSYRAPNFSERVLPPELAGPDLNYYKVTIGEDGNIRWVRRIYDGSEFQLPMTDGQLEFVATIFEGVPKKLLPRKWKLDDNMTE